MEYSSIFVCLMGMGTVFFGLICLIALTYLMSAVVGRGKKAAPAPVPAAPQTAGEVTPELVAAVSAALAEELGTDITGIRIVSMKKWTRSFAFYRTPASTSFPRTATGAASSCWASPACCCTWAS
ncbi:OadG family protein [Dysosmobacter sp.]|uniref:OadG family protein n=2 Tax=Dysosmobacter sp. TaxID=2591382 RepID=UPI003AB20941